MDGLLKFWVCSRCGLPLPTGGIWPASGRFGYIWRFKYNQFMKVNEKRKEPKTGLLCDGCNKHFQDLKPLKDAGLFNNLKKEASKIVY